MKQGDIKKLMNIFDSILSLVSEGSELMRPLNVYTYVGKEATQGYNITKKYSVVKKQVSSCPYCHAVDRGGDACWQCGKSLKGNRYECSTRDKCEKYYAIGPPVCIDCQDYEREPKPGDTLGSEKGLVNEE